MSDDLNFDMEVVNAGSPADSKNGVDEQTPASGRKEKSTDTEVPSVKLWPSPPDDWEMVRGSEIYDANPTGYAAEGEVDYIEMDALKTDLPDPKYVGRRDPSDYSGQMFAEGDTLFAQITPCTENGKAALVPKLQSEVGIGSTEFIVLSPDETKVLPRYLYYLSKSHPVHNYAVSRMRGSTGRQRVPVDVFRQELRIPVPPLPEQRKIASVLYTVDQAIQKTEAIIEQVKRTKTGISQRLFHSGIEQEETADTWLGELPKSWRVVRFSEIIASTRNGLYKEKDAYGSGVPIVKMREMFKGINLKVDDKTDRLQLSKDELKKFRIEPGDLLFARRSLNVEGAGKCTFVNSTCEDVVFESSIIRARLKRKIYPKFYAYYFESPVGSKSMKRIVNTVAASGINGTDLRNLRVPVPDFDEQKRIAEILSAFDQKRRELESEIFRLRQLKKGLMQDLLTGGVRTADKAIEVLDEVEAQG